MKTAKLIMLILFTNLIFASYNWTTETSATNLINTLQAKSSIQTNATQDITNQYNQTGLIQQAPGTVSVSQMESSVDVLAILKSV